MVDLNHYCYELLKSIEQDQSVSIVTLNYLLVYNQDHELEIYIFDVRYRVVISNIVSPWLRQQVILL